MMMMMIIMVIKFVKVHELFPECFARAEQLWYLLYDLWHILFIIIFAAVPYLESPLENVATLEDENVTFICMAAGVPQPTVTWYSNGQLLGLCGSILSCTHY